MPIYQKGISTFSKLADIYLKNTTNFTRICKVYICTGANSFELVYNGCDACNCESFCDSFCGETNSTCYCPCIYQQQLPPTGGVGPSSLVVTQTGFFPDPITYTVKGVCGCNSKEPEDWAKGNETDPTLLECTEDWCYLGEGNCPSPGCYSNVFWFTCKDDYKVDDDPGCEETPESCVCPPGEVGSAFCPTIDGGLNTIDNIGEGGDPKVIIEICKDVQGEYICWNYEITYLCAKPCCLTSPNGGYSTCNDYNNKALNTGDSCCRTKVLTYTDFGFGKTYVVDCFSQLTPKVITSFETCCKTNLTCDTP